MVVIIVIVALAAIAIAAFFILRRRNKASESSIEDPPPSTATVQNRSVRNEPEQQASAPGSPENLNGREVSGKQNKADQSLKLSFVRDDRERFDMQDLLRASAEVLGSGCFGSSYKAALLSGPVMVVKRYKQMNNVGKEDFQEHMRRIGRLAHPNLLPLVAYYYKKEEKLLISDHVQKGSLAVHLHGKFLFKHIDALHDHILYTSCSTDKLMHPIILIIKLFVYRILIHDAFVWVDFVSIGDVVYNVVHIVLLL